LIEININRYYEQDNYINPRKLIKEVFDLKNEQEIFVNIMNFDEYIICKKYEEIIDNC
jgi:hypothetical protein